MAELNPEFRRHLWLELTPQRLVIVPLVIGLIVAALWLAISRAAAGDAARVLLWALPTFWGSRLAADALIDEVTGRTWESQRMTALAPWSMTWGKLFGGTIVTWYGALWCILALALTLGPAPALGEIIYAVLAGLLAQSLALLFAALVLRLHDGSIRAHVTLAQATALLLTYAAYKVTVSGALVTWYGFDIDRAVFGVLSLVTGIVWAMLGIHRCMRAEMQASGGPGLWLGFVLYAAAYAGGFARIIDMPSLILIDAGQQQLVAGILVVLALTYVGVFLTPKRFARLRWFLVVLRRRDWRAAWPLLPPWCGSLLIAVVLVAAFPLAALDTARPLASTARPAVFLAACLLFTLRDLGLILALTLDEQRGRSHATALVYLGVLYGALPLLLTPLGWRVALPILVPWPVEGPVLALGPVALQAALACWLLRVRWRRLGAHATTQNV